MVAALKVGAADSALVGHWIDGRIVAGEGPRRAPVYNPALGVPVREVLLADRAQVDAAVQSAQRAQPAWGRVTALQRARVLFRFKELLLQNSPALARTLSEEHGKTTRRRRGRADARHGSGRVRLRRAATAQGRIQRERRHRRRQLRRAPAAGRGRRHHAVQFPGHGADVDVPGGAGRAATPSSSSPRSAIRRCR